MTYDPVYQTDTPELVLIFNKTALHHGAWLATAQTSKKYAYYSSSAARLEYPEASYKGVSQRPVLYLNIYNQMFDFIILIQR